MAAIDLKPPLKRRPRNSPHAYRTNAAGTGKNSRAGDYRQKVRS